MIPQPESNGSWWGGQQPQPKAEPSEPVRSAKWCRFVIRACSAWDRQSPTIQPPMPRHQQRLNPSKVPSMSRLAVDFAAIIPGQMETSHPAHMAAELWQVPAPPEMSYMETARRTFEALQRHEPMPSQDAHAAPPANHHPLGTVEDATADLLRPMLAAVAGGEHAAHGRKGAAHRGCRERSHRPQALGAYDCGKHCNGTLVLIDHKMSQIQ